MTEAWFGSWFGFRQAAALLLATVPLGLCHCAAPTPKPHASGAEVGGASAGAPAFDAAGSAGASTGGAPSAGSSSMSTGGSSPGTVTTGVETALPELPTFTQVGAVVRGDSVEIAFTPVDSAVDYRVYPLPRDEDVAVDASGLVTIKNAIYRCAGNRQAPGVRTDIRGEDSGNGIVTLVEPNGGTTVSGYVRTLDEATLGYVRVTPAPGFIPVYALGASPAGSDNGCDSKRWNESRDKRYTVSEQERGELLSQRYRDDGVAFYVPDTPGAETHSVYTSKDLDENRLYYVDGPEAALRGTDEAAFQVLNQLPSDAGPELQPLMRVYYYNVCGNDHDELAPGNEPLLRARYQGDQLPLFDLHWSGLDSDTTLVVEALDSGCPYQGMLGPVSVPALTSAANIDYPAILTLDEMRQASASSEVFVNGQHDTQTLPRAIARSFVQVSPEPAPDMDWYAGFGKSESLPDFQALSWSDPCGETQVGPTCWESHRDASSWADLSFITVEPERYLLGTLLGELWVMYADVGADVGGKFRLTPSTSASINADSFLHVTWQVDAFTTARRYPQVFISDQTAPIQWKLPDGNTLVFQTFIDSGTANWPNSFTMQICDHRGWEVNNQCPRYDLYRIDGLSPNAEAAEHTGVDHAARFDVYVSSARAYLLLDGEPHGCIDLPSAGVPSGSVSVTFGDVLYHSGVDSVFDFHQRHQQIVAKRHFDNLGYKSGVGAPAWDEERFPCATGDPMP